MQLLLCCKNTFLILPDSYAEYRNMPMMYLTFNDALEIDTHINNSDAPLVFFADCNFIRALPKKERRLVQRAYMAQSF